MALTVRNVVDALYRYLRKELREVPFIDATLENPLKDALLAINGQLQEMGALSPLFSAKQSKSALFRSPETATVVTASQYGTTAILGTSWPDRMLGCRILLNGETQPNRIVSISTTTATLQNPILGASAAGSATVQYDAAELPSNVITVHEPVRFVGGCPLRPANDRFDLEQPLYAEREDYGRVMLRSVPGGENAYFIESYMQAGASRPKLRMMLRDAPTADSVVEFQARVSFGNFTASDVHGAAPGFLDPSTPVPIPNEFVESVFLPLAVMRFFATPVMRDVNPPSFAEQNAATAREILARMKPQSRKRASLYPAFG